MKNAKVNFNIKLEAKGVIALVAVALLLLAALLYFALGSTQNNQAPANQAPAAAEGSAQGNPEPGQGSPTLSAPEAIAYIGNRSSKIFHYPDCRYAGQISERNAVHFPSIAEAAGYDPCSVCMR